MSKKVYLSLDNWTYADLSTFVASMAGDNRVAIDLARKIIVKWDYTSDLNGDDPMGELGLEESTEVMNAIMKTIEQALTSIPDKEVRELVTVDIKQWKLRRYMDYDDAKRARNWSLIERMLREVCTMDGLAADKELTATQGFMMNKALQLAYARVVGGK